MIRLGKDQRIGFLIIGSLLLAVSLVKYGIRQIITPTIYENTKFDFDRLNAESFEQQSSIDYNEKEFQWKNNNDKYERTYESKEILFNFDPNTTSVDSLRLLPIPSFIADNIVKYRSKGGKFKKPDDLKRIYGIDNHFNKLLPFISIGSKITKDTINGVFFKKENLQIEDTNYFVKKFEKPSEDSISIKPKPKEKYKADVNVADEYQLMMVSGIGAYYAKVIIEYRDKLGGFIRKDQLYEIQKIPKERMDLLIDYLIVDPNKITKLCLNQVGNYKIISHPYLTRKQWNIVILYRDNHKGIKDLEDFKRVGIFQQSDIDKVKPYLCFDE
jgi:DNA uptake protein ComE-like DNA-binding protein